ncbi:monovalent cation/H(+) antiporter subunit G [Micropruina sp.]|uniref:monovalent cation/H(+) antiporter subunit G n=1 Tax=Micropruina sp. TaxID=2737536 RepID=UPI002620ACE8|nr:monovalent cation/H(+) antiporter subunit G [Micropruina sp.]
MSADEIFDLVGAVFLVGGAFFCLGGALGLVRFPDVLARMHAATKPQVFGLLLVLLGVGFSIRDPKVWLTLLVVILLQVLTAPVAGHLIGRVAYRSGAWEPDDLLVDELSDDLRDAGFSRNEEFRPERGKDRPKS